MSPYSSPLFPPVLVFNFKVNVANLKALRASVVKNKEFIKDKNYSSI